MLEETGKSREQHVADSYSIYTRIVEKTKSEQTKLKARARIDKLLGLDAPKRHEISGPDAGPITSEVHVKEALRSLSDEELRMLKRVKDRMASLTAGQPNGHEGN
jgi:hypothetical protein